MGDHSRSHSHDLLHLLGFGSLCRACKSFLSKCYPEKHSFFFRKTANRSKPRPFEEDNNINRFKNQNYTKRNQERDKSKQIHHKRKGSLDANIPTRSPQWSPLISTTTTPPPFSRNTSFSRSFFTRTTSKKSQTPSKPGKASLSRSMSHKEGALPAAHRHALSRSTSRIGSTIIFSNSHGFLKPAAMEKQLDCTLEDLCFGCIKKVNITRDAITEDGEIVEEEEVLTIKVQPGWKKGTKITFEGKGHEMPGAEPADVIFVVSEKQHPLFKRQEDDLELGVEILLVDALTGCTLFVPLLGGQTKRLTIDDVVYPGYQKIIPGEGMTKQNKLGTRGNLTITISIKFPEDLTDKQRSIAANILQQSC